MEQQNEIMLPIEWCNKGLKGTIVSIPDGTTSNRVVHPRWYTRTKGRPFQWCNKDHKVQCYPSQIVQRVTRTIDGATDNCEFISAEHAYANRHPSPSLSAPGSELVP